MGIGGLPEVKKTRGMHGVAEEGGAGSPDAFGARGDGDGGEPYFGILVLLDWREGGERRGHTMPIVYLSLSCGNNPVQASTTLL